MSFIGCFSCVCMCVFCYLDWVSFRDTGSTVWSWGGVSIVTAIKNCNKDTDKEGDDKKEKGLTQN